MAVTVRSVGAVSAAETAINVPEPAGVEENDIVLVFLESAGVIAGENANVEPTMAEPWVRIFTEKNGNTRLSVFACKAKEIPSYTTSDTGNHQMGRAIALKGAAAVAVWKENIRFAVGESTKPASSLEVETPPGLAIAAVAGDLPDATAEGTQFGGWVIRENGEVLAESTERIDNTTAAGDGGSLGVATCPKSFTGVSTFQAEKSTSSKWVALSLVVTAAKTEVTPGVAKETDSAANPGLKHKLIREATAAAETDSAVAAVIYHKQVIAPGVAVEADEAVTQNIDHQPRSTIAEQFHARRQRQVRLAARLDLAEGEPLIVGPDEVGAANVPISMSFDTELPGGFGPGSITLPVVDGITETTARLFARVTVYDADTGNTYYRGRVSTVQLTATQVQLSTEGMAKHLEDDETASEIFYDRDLTGWEGPTIEREKALKEAGYQVTGATVEADVEAPALVCSIQGAWAAGALARSNGWYDAGSNNRIAEIDYAWKRGASITPGAPWDWELFTSDSPDKAENGQTTGDLGSSSGPGSGTLTADTEGNRYACAQLYYTEAGGTSNLEYKIFWTLLGVVGGHGLPLQGTVAAPDEGRGVLGSDAAAYVVSTWAPLLSFSTGSLGSIEPTTFPIPHLAFKDDTTARAMVEQIALYGGEAYLPLDWGVYDDFFMRSPGTYGRTWRVRKDQAVESNDNGPDAGERLNGVKVSYDDGTGKRRTVGPVGSGADAEYADLEDADPSNPANQDGARHWRQFDAGITSEAGAVLIGQLILNKANTIFWRGDVTVKGWATTDEGEELPAALVRAGDYVIVEDEDQDTRPRRIVNTGYDPASETVSASCGAPPDYLDVLMARNEAVLRGRV